jgi:hypothetical protein
MANMKYLIVMFLFILKDTSYSQCKKEIDEFTHDTIIRSNIETLGKTSIYYLETQIIKTNGMYLLALTAEFLSVQTIEKGDLVYLKFEDESIFKLPITKTVISDHKKGKAFSQGTKNTIWYNELVFTLDKPILEDLKNKGLIKLRVNYWDYEVKEKNRFKVAQQIECVNQVK